MNDGLKGEGKDIISNVEKKESKLATNLTDFYNNDKLAEETKTTEIFSGETTLNKEEKESKIDKFVKISEENIKENNKSNAIYDFVASLKDSVFGFLSVKKIIDEDGFNKRLDYARSFTLLVLFISICEFIFLHGVDSLRMMITVLPCVLFGISYFLFKDHNKKGIITSLIASVFLILSLKVINIIFGVINLIGMLLLLRYKKKTP